MNNNETFKLLSKTEMTIDYITKELLNYPKYEVVLRNKIESVMYDMIYQIHSYRITQNKRVKSKNLNDLIIYQNLCNIYIHHKSDYLLHLQIIFHVQSHWINYCNK